MRGVHGRRGCKLSRRRRGAGNRYCRRWPDRNRQIFYQFVLMMLIRWQRWRDNTKQVASLAVSSRRGSTRRPKARLPPAHTALVGPVHSQNGGRDDFVRSWLVLTRQISSCAIKHRPYRFFLQGWAGRYVLLAGAIGTLAALFIVTVCRDCVSSEPRTPWNLTISILSRVRVVAAFWCSRTPLNVPQPDHP